MSVALDSVMESQAAQLNLLLYQIYRPYFNGKTHTHPLLVHIGRCEERAGLRKAFVTLELAHVLVHAAIFFAVQTLNRVGGPWVTRKL